MQPSTYSLLNSAPRSIRRYSSSVNFRGIRTDAAIIFSKIYLDCCSLQTPFEFYAHTSRMSNLNHHIVPVYNLIMRFEANRGLDLRAFQPLDEPDIGGGIIRKSARETPPLFIMDLDQFAGAEFS